MTIFQRFSGQTVGCITLLLALLPGLLPAEAILTVSDTFLPESTEIPSFKPHYPVSLDQIIDPGI